MTQPNISPDFTIEDIHKIREYHYELTKDMPFERQRAFYHEGTLALRELMAQRAANGKSQQASQRQTA